jgi:hypothetical protein
MKVEVSFSVTVYPGDEAAEQEFTQPAFHKRFVREAADFNETELRAAFEDFVRMQKVAFLD